LWPCGYLQEYQILGGEAETDEDYTILSTMNFIFSVLLSEVLEIKIKL